MSDPALNPFIEKSSSGSVPGHSKATTTASSASPKPVVLPGDVVIAGPASDVDTPGPKKFEDSLAAVLGLDEDTLDGLRNADKAALTPVEAAALQGAALALGLPGGVDAALEAAGENSFLARLSLLHPSSLTPEQSKDIAAVVNGVKTSPSSSGSGSGPDDATAAAAIVDLLKQLVYTDPAAGMIAYGVRPLKSSQTLSTHVTSPIEFSVLLRGPEDSVESTVDVLPASSMSSKKKNLFYDSGVSKYYTAAGGASPASPFESRKLLGAAVWYAMCVLCILAVYVPCLC
jgi:hypothetical protein